MLSRSLPVCFVGATPPRPDPGHPPSTIGGVVKRFGYKTPKINRRMRRRLTRFITLWLRHNLTPLTDADIPTFEQWRDNAPYSQARKAELTRVWDKQHRKPNKTRFANVKSFIKDETYPEFKYPRIINSRVDEAKCYFGPEVQAVSDRLFALPHFIKKIPVPERPEYLRDLLMATGDEDYVFTDYTAFEAHFVEEIMMITQVALFRYMLSKTTDHAEWLDMYTSVMTGTNKLAFKHFHVFIQATRMSGEMDTSLSNGFSNLMIFLFLVSENHGKAVGSVEGDDGIFKVSPSSAAPTKEQFEELGFTIKIEHTKELSEASFCGQVYDMSDLIVVTDPLEVIARVGWTNKKYVQCSERTALSLLRAKGYSLVYQYNGCPMLDCLGRRILELTAGVQIPQRVLNNMDQWERAKVVAAMNNTPEPREPGANTRGLVEKLYGVSVPEQTKFEEWTKTMEFGLHKMPCIDRVHESWSTYYENYTTSSPTTDPSWLLRSERGFLQRLNAVPNCVEFVRSLAA